MSVLNLSTNVKARFFDEQLRALERRNVRSTTLGVPGDQWETQSDTRSRSLVDYARFYPTVLRHALRNYDVLHANYGLTAPFGLAQPRLPTVLTLWGSDLFGRYGSVSRLAARYYDAVVVMSEEMARALDVDAHVIPHGVDLDRFRPIDREAARREVGWDPDGLHVLFPYSPNRSVKNYPLAERVVDATETELDREITLQTLSGVPHERMAYYYNAADALLLTSRREGSPNSVKEAMACNVPVVATAVGDVPERLAGVSESVVAESDDELVAGLADVLAGDRRSDGRDAARAVSLDRMGGRLVEVYEQVIADAG
ncbi:glycosyltransferase family 4 protein [Halobacteriaceae archaeon GCM10025711]